MTGAISLEMLVALLAWAGVCALGVGYFRLSRRLIETRLALVHVLAEHDAQRCPFHGMTRRIIGEADDYPVGVRLH